MKVKELKEILSHFNNEADLIAIFKDSIQGLVYSKEIDFYYNPELIDNAHQHNKNLVVIDIGDQQ